MYLFQSKSFLLLPILFLFLFSTSVLAQRKPERIIEKEEVEKFKATLDSALCLYTTDSVYRKPILEIGNNPFLDSLIEYNLQEYAFYLNNYWYELDNNTPLSLENTAPQEGYIHKLFSKEDGFGYKRKGNFCNCGREHIWSNERKNRGFKSDSSIHYVYYNSNRGVEKLRWKFSRTKIIKKWKHDFEREKFSEQRRHLEYLGNGFEKKEILEGNIGYLKCSFLPTANYIDEQFMENLVKEFLFTNSLILDLRGSFAINSDLPFYKKDKTVNELSVPLWLVERFLRPDTVYNLGTAKVFHTRRFAKYKGNKAGKILKKTYSNPTINLTTRIEETKNHFYYKKRKYNGYHSDWKNDVILDEDYKKYYTFRYYEQPIYILTDKNTSDAAEWITQVLQKYRNAIVIGEPTKGQATVTQQVGTTAYTWLNIPDIEILSEETKIQPNVFVSAYDTTSTDKAFDIAYKMAYEESVMKHKLTYIRSYGQRFKQFEEITKPIPNPYQLPQNAKELLGNYGLGKEIIFKDGKLWLKNYQNISPLYMTAPNTFLVKDGLKKEFKDGYSNPYSTVAKPIYLFFRKGQDDFQANESSIDSTLEIKQDSIMNMFVRYGDFTSAKFTQLESYDFDKFKTENQGIDTTQIIKPSAAYPFSKMSLSEKQALFDGFTMQRNLFDAFPNFNFKLISENEIVKENLENNLTVFVFWSPSSTKFIESISKFNEMIETYSENSITFYGFTEDKKKDVEEFLIGTPFYADIISNSNSIFEDLYIPTTNEPVILILGKEGKFLFGEILNEGSFEKMEYILSNQILK